MKMNRTIQERTQSKLELETKTREKEPGTPGQRRGEVQDLDPCLPWDSLEALVNYPYALGEIETFKTYGQACTLRTKLLCSSPPSMEFFAPSNSPAVLDPSSGG